MEKSKRDKKGRWVKGQSGNLKGGPKLNNEYHTTRKLTRPELEAKINKFIAMDRGELIKVGKNPSTKVIDLIIIKILHESVNKGDQVRLAFILDRLIGRPKEIIELKGELKVGRTKEEIMTELAEIKVKREQLEK